METELIVFTAAVMGVLDNVGLINLDRVVPGTDEVTAIQRSAYPGELFNGDVLQISVQGGKVLSATLQPKVHGAKSLSD